MAHVVMQSAEFPSIEHAMRCETELQALFEKYIEFERTDPNPWGGERVPPPLVAFAERHGIVWPASADARFALKGTFDDAAELLRVDRMVFFWGGGFDLGGGALQQIFVRLGAISVAQRCHLRIRNDDPVGRVSELTAFLDDEDFADQYAVAQSEDEATDSLFSLAIEGPNETKYIVFDDSGVEDWAFVTLVPQLDGEDPALVRSDVEIRSAT